MPRSVPQRFVSTFSLSRSLSRKSYLRIHSETSSVLPRRSARPQAHFHSFDGGFINERFSFGLCKRHGVASLRVYSISADNRIFQLGTACEGSEHTGRSGIFHPPQQSTQRLTFYSRTAAPKRRPERRYPWVLAANSAYFLTPR